VRVFHLERRCIFFQRELEFLLRLASYRMRVILFEGILLLFDILHRLG